MSSGRYRDKLTGVENKLQSRDPTSHSLLHTPRLTIGEPAMTIIIACFSGSESSQQRQLMVPDIIIMADVDTNTRKIIDTAAT